MSAETDKFIVASFAMWAGDFQLFEELLRQYSPPGDTPSIQSTVDAPEHVIRAAGALRLRQLWQKRGEFNKFVEDYRAQGYDIAEHPDIIETSHLRATLWRIGERNFSMRGFLKDLTWQEQLFAHARSEAERSGSTLPRTPTSAPTTHSPQEGTLTGVGVSWSVVGNPFMQVTLTDLGFLEVSALWIGSSLPDTVEQVRLPLFKLLSMLDESPGDEREEDLR